MKKFPCEKDYYRVLQYNYLTGHYDRLEVNPSTVILYKTKSASEWPIIQLLQDMGVFFVLQDTGETIAFYLEPITSDQRDRLYSFLVETTHATLVSAIKDEYGFYPLYHMQKHYNNGEPWKWYPVPEASPT